MIAGREPRGQHWLAYALLVALAVVVFGSMIGEFITIHGGWRRVWQWFGGQGFEYLDLGRFWQALLTVGLFFLGNHHLSRITRKAPDGASGEPAVVILLLGPFHPHFLRRRIAGQSWLPFHQYGFLAILGGPSVGRRLSRAVYHNNGCLHFRATGRRT